MKWIKAGENSLDIDLAEIRSDFYQGTLFLKGVPVSGYETIHVAADNKKEAYNILKEKFKEVYPDINIKENPYVTLEDGRIMPRKVD